MTERPDWNQYFLDGAKWVSTRADCRRRQHGAIIVKGNRIVATGYNGGPSGRGSCLKGDCPRGLLSYDELKTMTSYDEGPGRCIAIHAEQNALLYSDRSKIEGGTIYVTGKPCPTCRRLIGGSGLSRLVYAEERSTYGYIEELI
jgi:dCMP deaminase